MNRSIRILSILVLLTLASAVNAQTSATCGIIDINASSNVAPGTPLVFKVKVLQAPHPEFNWFVSSGKITKGQGTDEITLDTAGLVGFVITATVQLFGAPAGCKSVEAITTNVALPPPACDLKFDEYGNIKFKDEQARLDNFAIQVSNWPKSTGLIMISARRETFKGEAAYRLARAKSYLSDFRGIDSSRVITVDCGFSQELLTKLYIVPFEGPMATCDTSSSISLSEVKFTKSRPRSARHSRRRPQRQHN